MDYCSRGLLPQELVDHTLWWAGPTWLAEFELVPETSPELGDFSEKEKNSTTFISAVSDMIVDSLLMRFSSLDKIVRIFAYCLRFINRARLKPIPEAIAVD